ncbi:hypothetical protein [Photobacterium damselae]|uniref:hypothetical protein n=1 Tax=Photobacterium damselae TaxID=38293 RepID=UPI0035A8BED9
MKYDDEIIILLEKICAFLKDNWKVDYIKSELSFSKPYSCTFSYSYFLFNDKKVYIRIYNVNNEKSCLSIGTVKTDNERHYYFSSTNKINLNLKKNFNLVISDIKRRLIAVSYDAVVCKMEMEKQEKEKSFSNDESRYFVMEAIKKNIRSNIENPYRNDYVLSREIELKGRKKKILKQGYMTVNLATLHHKSSTIDKFDLDLYNLTPDQVVKVLSILEY